MSINSTNTLRLKKLLEQLLNELERINGTSTTSNDNSDDAYLYILLIMIFYGCLAGGLILAYTRSRKQESKDDPYHLYIEREWGRYAKKVDPVDESHHRGSIESEHLL